MRVLIFTFLIAALSSFGLSFLKDKTTVCSASYEEIGRHKDGRTIYLSVFTFQNLDTAAYHYQKRLDNVATRSNFIILFYNKRNEAPSSEELKDLTKILNCALIGGLEKWRGLYYILIPENNELVRSEEIITLIKSVQE